MVSVIQKINGDVFWNTVHSSICLPKILPWFDKFL